MTITDKNYSDLLQILNFAARPNSNIEDLFESAKDVYKRGDLSRIAFNVYRRIEKIYKERMDELSQTTQSYVDEAPSNSSETLTNVEPIITAKEASNPGICSKIWIAVSSLFEKPSAPASAPAPAPASVVNPIPKNLFPTRSSSTSADGRSSRQKAQAPSRSAPQWLDQDEFLPARAPSPTKPAEQAARQRNLQN